MKRQIVLILSILLFTCLAKAQIFPYYFSVIEEAIYTNLSDSISLNQGQIWDDPEYIIDLEFDFDYFDTVSDSIAIFGTATLVSPFVSEDDTVLNLLIPYISDIIDIGDTSGIVSVSEISYKIEGEVGSQIAKIEWKNVGFYNEVSDFGTANNYLSFQLWLYEGSNDIEVHFGPNNIEDDNLVHDLQVNRG